MSLGRCTIVAIHSLCGLFLLSPAMAQPLAPAPQAVPLQPAQRVSREEQTVREASAVLTEIMSVPAKAIPRHLLADAYGIAIVPGVVKGGLVVGVRHGRGVVLTRDDQNRWQAPIFVSLTGGSVGWQIGLQSTDVILVFKSRKSINGLMNGKLTIGVDAAASAGPVGRNAAAATDGRLQAEILSYSRSRGLFAGVSIDGSSIAVDRNAGAGYYQQFQVGAGGQVVQTPGVVPQSGVNLVAQLTAYTDGTDLPANPAPGAVIPNNVAPDPIAPGVNIDLGQAEPAPGTGIVATPQPAYANASQSAVVASLHESHGKLNALLDPQWQAHLALPDRGIDAQQFNVTAWQAVAARYDQVAADARYAALTQRAEFTQTHRLVRDYVGLMAKESKVISLPPPPN